MSCESMLDLVFLLPVFCTAFSCGQFMSRARFQQRARASSIVHAIILSCAATARISEEGHAANVIWRLHPSLTLWQPPVS